MNKSGVLGKRSSKRFFYQQMGIAEHWSVSQLRNKQNGMILLF